MQLVNPQEQELIHVPEMHPILILKPFPHYNMMLFPMDKLLPPVKHLVIYQVKGVLDVIKFYKHLDKNQQLGTQQKPLVQLLPHAHQQVKLHQSLVPSVVK